MICSRRAIGVFLLLTIVSSCGTRRFTGIENVGSGEAVAFGRIKILHNGKDVTEGANVIIDAPSTGIVRWQYQLDRDGVIVAQLPTGNHSVTHIIVESGLSQHRFETGELSFDLPEGRKVYYLGDVTMDWRGAGAAASVPLMVAGAVTGGVMGAALGSTITQGGIVVSVDDQQESASATFHQRFPTEGAVVSSPLRVTPRPST